MVEGIPNDGPNQILVRGRSDCWGGVNLTGTSVLEIDLHKSQEVRPNLSRL